MQIISSQHSHICFNENDTKIWFLVNEQRDVQFFSMYLFLFLTLYMFRAHCAYQSGETNCVNTTSGNCHSVYCRWPCRVQPRSSLPTCTRHGHRHSDSYQRLYWHTVSPDDKHDVLETCRELKIKTNTQKRIVRHVGHLPRIIIWSTVNKM